jgi:hypothetical protein
MGKPARNTLESNSFKASVGKLDFAGIVAAAKAAHAAGLPEFNALVGDLGKTDHRRARRIALNRLRFAYDQYGQSALVVLRGIKSRARDKADPARYFLAAALAEFKKRGWLK